MDPGPRAGDLVTHGVLLFDRVSEGGSSADSNATAQARRGPRQGPLEGRGRSARGKTHRKEHELLADCLLTDTDRLILPTNLV